MAKDYFQDIVPPHASHAGHPAHQSAKKHAVSVDDYADEIEYDALAESAPVPTRSIRNISITPSRTRTRAPEPEMMTEDDDEDRPIMPPTRRRSPSFASSGAPRWLWGLAGALVMFLGILGVVALRPTTVTVTPRTQLVTFDQSVRLTAQPVSSAVPATVPYMMQGFELEDSAVVAAQGMQHVDSKASGSVVIYNDYSAAPVRLIKDTRFSTPDGLIFRIPADVVIPGKTASTPGRVSVTVVADAAGDKYNVGPISRFTVPGLKNGPMYAHVYGVSTVAMAGGFSGEQPGVEPSALNAAIADVRGRLEKKAHDMLVTASSSIVTFPGLAQITYQTLPNTAEAGGGVRIHQKAVVSVPAFPVEIFAGLIGQSVSAAAEDASISILPVDSFDAAYASSTTIIDGTKPFTFTLSGSAKLVWKVDSGALQQALAGKDKGAFDTVVNGFPAIGAARARIEPFWKSVFPSDSTQIRIIVNEVQAQ